MVIWELAHQVENGWPVRQFQAIMVGSKLMAQGPGFAASGYDDRGARRADGEPVAEGDPFDHTVVYRLRRDALHLTCKLNAGRTLSDEGIRVQLVFISPCFVRQPWPTRR